VTATVGADETALNTRRSTGTLPALDSMRAIAALAVVATHASFWGGAYASPRYGTALARLDIGVAIFFVLSGFLLSLPWLERHAGRLPAPSTGRYLWKRALRIFPVYVLAVAAAMLLLHGNNGAGPAQWVKTLTLTDIYLDSRLPDGLTQMWSLATEAAFYVVLPGIMWLGLSRRRRGASPSRVVVVMALLVLVNLVWVLGLSQLFDGAGSSGLWLPSYLTWFAVGIAIAACSVQVRLTARDRAVVPARLASVLSQMGRAPGVCWTAGLAVFVVAATPLAGPSSLSPPTLGEAVAKNLTYAVVAGLVILPGVFADPGGRYIRAMSTPLLRHLGHISYGVFCVHLVVLELVARWRDMTLFEGRTFELFATTLVISVVVSEVLYRLVERPAMNLKNLGRAASSVDSSVPSAAATRS
jgi:peptidoglycan/LPS O-acetylase OafA/YrhL